jgi:hypothetical protein
MTTNSTIKSACCNAGVKSVGMGDFYDKDEICTWHYECEKCLKSCDIQPININNPAWKTKNYKPIFEELTPEFPAPLSDKLDQPDYQRMVKWLWFLVGVAVFCNIFQFIIILSLIK